MNRTRRYVIISIMIALAVVGRFIPFFKPVAALTIISAIYIGIDAGFLVGSLSIVLSNFYFGQGPWTPFQMLAFGLVGLIAALLNEPLRKSRVFLLIFGAVSGFLLSAVMDVWTVIWYNGSFDVKLYLTAFVTALPHTILYVISNVIFLYFMAKPFGEKLERIKVKYGL